MSSLSPGDGHLHYSDNSHRWSHPSDPDLDEQQHAEVQAHLEAHAEALRLGRQGGVWPGKLRNRSEEEPHA